MKRGNLKESMKAKVSSALSKDIVASLSTFKGILILLIAVDIFIVGLCLPSPTKNGFNASFFFIFLYILLLNSAVIGLFCRRVAFLLPVFITWIVILAATILVMVVAVIEYVNCSWIIYFHPDEDIRKKCKWTFMRSSADPAIYILIFGVKLSQIFLAHVVMHLMGKAERISTFEPRKTDHESDDDDDVVVFERTGAVGPGAKEAAIA